MNFFMHKLHFNHSIYAGSGTISCRFRAGIHVGIARQECPGCSSMLLNWKQQIEMLHCHARHGPKNTETVGPTYRAHFAPQCEKHRSRLPLIGNHLRNRIWLIPLAAEAARRAFHGTPRFAATCQAKRGNHAAVRH
jgi:hypothetical protein